MASDDNRGKAGRGDKERSNLDDSGAMKKGAAPGFVGVRQERKAEARESGPSGPPGAARQRHPSVSSDLADQIGARLRGVYDDVLAQPVPERFLELLRQLESAPGASFARAKKDGT